MKHVLGLAVIAAMLAAPAIAQEPSPQELDARAKEAKTVIKRLVTAMQGELKAAKEERGPGGAVNACQHLAPQVAADLKEETGWDIRRTALKVRNPKNRPRAEELLVLEAYAARADKGAPLAEMETVQTAVYQGERGVHFMKAIPVQKACLGCHGSKLAPGVAEALQKAYPEDQATGFAEGDLRGAFSLFKPIKATE